MKKITATLKAKFNCVDRDSTKVPELKVQFKVSSIWSCAFLALASVTIHGHGKVLSLSFYAIVIFEQLIPFIKRLGSDLLNPKFGSQKSALL